MKNTMTRITRVAAPHHVVPNGNSTNGDLPPSTRAAQLAEHLTNNQTQAQDSDSESFQQLLREVLAGNFDQSTEDDLEIEVNGRLIFVIVRAGIEAAISPSPFISSSSLRKHVVDSLRAIELTVQRSPGVLYTAAPSPPENDEPGVPLYQWLLPKVLALLSKNEFLELFDQIVALLVVCIKAQEIFSKPDLGSAGVLIYIKGFIRGRKLS